jgi:serine/threonine protein kinase
MDFGLAKILENSSPDAKDTYEMSGETGSLRYMSPEVADSLPYNHKADVYSFGMSHLKRYCIIRVCVLSDRLRLLL